MVPSYENIKAATDDVYIDVCILIKLYYKKGARLDVVYRP